MSSWDRETAEWYAEKYGEYETNRLGVEALSLQRDSVVVDVGCGTGCALRHASRVVTVGELIGVDPVPRMLEIARERTADHSAADRIRYCAGAAEDLPIDDERADFVLAFDSFDHWVDPVQGLEEVRRVMNARGCFAVLKDACLAYSRETRVAFDVSLANAGFAVREQQDLRAGDIKCTLWLCVSAPS